MTISAYLADTVTGGILADLVATQGAYIAEGVTVGSTGDSAIHGTGGQQTITALGDVFGVGAALDLEGDNGSFGYSVYVGEEADITGHDGKGVQGYGINIFAAQSRVENHGSIFGFNTGIGFMTLGEVAAEARSIILNTGNIAGGDWGIQHDSLETLIIRNRGTIEGDINAVSGGFGVDKLYNTGLIFGEVDLSGGDDLYIARKGGSVDGTVNGGSGNDILRGASDDDWLAGSYGKDTVYGGKGEDVFYFDNSISGAADADKILDFTIADDTIALNSIVYSGLIGKDLTPTIRGGPGSGTKGNGDIRYDITTGQLSINPDGPGGVPFTVIAELSPGLKLTAADFMLV